VSLRSYAQKNPLLEYKLEGSDIFNEMIEDIRIHVAKKIIRVRIEKAPASGQRRGRRTGAGLITALCRALGPLQNNQRKEAAPAKRSRSEGLYPRSAGTIRVPAAAARSTSTATERTHKRGSPRLGFNNKGAEALFFSCLACRRAGVSFAIFSLSTALPCPYTDFPTG
jgi:preprotein translocase subunit SecA